MPKIGVLSRVGDFLVVVRAAGRAASAVEAGRAPYARDLRTLGIDPAAFRSIDR